MPTPLEDAAHNTSSSRLSSANSTTKLLMEGTDAKQSDDEDTVPPLIMDDSKDNRGSDDDGISGPRSMREEYRYDGEATYYEKKLSLRSATSRFMGSKEHSKIPTTTTMNNNNNEKQKTKDERGRGGGRPTTRDLHDTSRGFQEERFS